MSQAEMGPEREAEALRRELDKERIRHDATRKQFARYRRRMGALPERWEVDPDTLAWALDVLRGAETETPGPTP